MDVLLLITVGCFFALFVTALAVARHVRFKPLRIPTTHGNADDLTPFLLRSESPRTRQPHAPGQSSAQNLHALARHKQPDWRFLTSDEPRRFASAGAFDPSVRRPPCPVRFDRHRHFDWTSFNEPAQRINGASDPSLRQAASSRSNRHR